MKCRALYHALITFVQAVCGGSSDSAGTVLKFSKMALTLAFDLLKLLTKDSKDLTQNSSAGNFGTNFINFKLNFKKQFLTSSIKEKSTKFLKEANIENSFFFKSTLIDDIHTPENFSKIQEGK